MGDCRRCSGNDGGAGRKSCQNESEIRRNVKQLEEALLALKRKKQSLERGSGQRGSCCPPPKPKKPSCGCNQKPKCPPKPACKPPPQKCGCQRPPPPKPKCGCQKSNSQRPSQSRRRSSCGCENDDRGGRADECDRDGGAKDEWEANVLLSLKLLMDHAFANQCPQSKSKSSCDHDKCNDRQYEPVKRKVSNRPDVCCEGQLQSVSVSSCEEDEDEADVCQLCKEESEDECGQRETCSLDDICKPDSEEDECDDGGKGKGGDDDGTGGKGKGEDDGAGKEKVKDDGAGKEKVKDDGAGKEKVKDDGKGKGEGAVKAAVAAPVKPAAVKPTVEKKGDDGAGKGKVKDDGGGKKKVTDDGAGKGKGKGGDDGTGGRRKGGGAGKGTGADGKNALGKSGYPSANFESCKPCRPVCPPPCVPCPPKCPPPCVPCPPKCPPPCKPCPPKCPPPCVPCPQKAGGAQPPGWLVPKFTPPNVAPKPCNTEPSKAPCFMNEKEDKCKKSSEKKPCFQDSDDEEDPC